MTQAYTSGAVPNLVMGGACSTLSSMGLGCRHAKSGASPTRSQTASSGYVSSTLKLTKLVILSVCRRS